MDDYRVDEHGNDGNVDKVGEVPNSLRHRSCKAKTCEQGQPMNMITWLYTDDLDCFGKQNKVILISVVDVLNSDFPARTCDDGQDCDDESALKEEESPTAPVVGPRTEVRMAHIVTLRQ